VVVSNRYVDCCATLERKKFVNISLSLKEVFKKMRNMQSLIF
jgi:hypothetical protein